MEKYLKKIFNKLNTKGVKNLLLAFSLVTIFNFEYFPISALPTTKTNKINLLTNLKNSVYNLQPEIDNHISRLYASNSNKASYKIKKQEKEIKNKSNIIKEYIHFYPLMSMSFLAKNLDSLELSNDIKNNCTEFSRIKYKEIQEKLQNLFDNHKIEEFELLYSSLSHKDDKTIKILEETADEAPLALITEVNTLSFNTPPPNLYDRLTLRLNEKIFVTVNVHKK